MTKYKRMNLGERENIFYLTQQNYPQTSIAKTLGRNKSSISRELARCSSDPLGYLPDRANDIAQKRTRRNLGIFNKQKSLEPCVVRLLKEGWSPEQISFRLKLENKNLKISHETIYKFIYSDKGIKQKLYLLLTRHKLKRTRWHSRKPRKSHIPEEANIKHRPKIIEKRKSIGHFEGNLVVFGSLRSSNVTTIVERKSRLTKLVHNQNKCTSEVIGGIVNSLSSLPKKLIKTITFDRGTEFAAYRNLGVTTYFCNPHSPWQKGGNENYNGRLRKYLPKHFDHRMLSQELLDNIEKKMNNQPRKCLGFRTPIEVFYNRKLQYVALDL